MRGLGYPGRAREKNPEAHEKTWAGCKCKAQGKKNDGKQSQSQVPTPHRNTKQPPLWRLARVLRAEGKIEQLQCRVVRAAGRRLPQATGKKRKRKRKRQLRLFFLNFFAFRHLTLNKSICPNAPKSYIAIECRTPNI